MSKLERLNDRVAKLLTMAVHDVLGVVKETVSEYQEKTARTQRENESLKRRLRELQDKLRIDHAGENPPLSGSSNKPRQDKTIKDEIEEVDPETGSSSERKFSLTLQKEMREEEMIFITDSNTTDCSVSPGLVTEDLSNVTNTDLTGHVSYWLPGEEHDVSVRQRSSTSVSPLCSQRTHRGAPIKAEPEPGYLCSPDQIEQGDTFNCGGMASGVSQRGSSPDNTENPDMADTVQYSDQWKQELDPANQDAAAFPFLGSIGAVSWETPVRRKSLRLCLKKQRSKSEPFVQNYTDEEEPLDWEGSERGIGPTSNEPAEPEPSEPEWRLLQRVVGRPKRYCCSLCGMTFRDTLDLKRHNRVHTGEKPYSCSVCGKHFSRPYYLKIHQRLHTGERPYGCTHCDKRFSQLGNLKIHQRYHTGEKPYSCTQCDKHFSHSSSLKNHQRQHTGERPYICTHCGKCFTRLEILKIHQRNHTREKPYSCTQCDKHFTQLCHLKIHQRHHTGEKPYSCTQCGKRFSYSSGFRRHQLTHL